MKIINFVLIVFVCCNARQFKELRNGPSEIEKFQNEYSNRIAFGESGIKFFKTIFKGWFLVSN